MALPSLNPDTSGMKNTTPTQHFMVTADHGYEGEKTRYFYTEAEARAWQAEQNADPYVMRTWLDDISIIGSGR